MKQTFSIRTLLMGIVLIIVLAVVILRGDQIVELAETIKQGSMLPIVIALVLQLGKYALQSLGYHFSFKAIGENYAIKHTLPLVFGTFFMNTIAPSANLAGITLVVDDARQRGISSGKAGSAALLMQITIDAAFALIVLVGFGALAVSVGLPGGWFFLGLVDIVVVLIMIGVLFLGRIHKALLIHILTVIDTLITKILALVKRKPLSPWVHKTADSFEEAADFIVRYPRYTLEAFACSLGASLCELTCFILVGIAFGVTGVQALVCGYVVATLFAMFSITPQGVGFVETAVTLAFTTFGESSAAGLSIGLVYRGIVFWMPFLIGAVLIQTTSSFKRR